MMTQQQQQLRPQQQPQQQRTSIRRRNISSSGGGGGGGGVCFSRIFVLIAVSVLRPCPLHAFHPENPPLHAFLSNIGKSNVQRYDSSVSPSSSSSSPSSLSFPDVKDYWIPRDALSGRSSLVLTMGGEKQKLINAHGLWCAVVTLVTCPFWMLAMTLIDWYGQIMQSSKNGDDHAWDPARAIYDQTGKVWSKVWLTCTNSLPTVSGTLYRDGPCLYVANHASWLDIAVLCTVLDPVFKFIAKRELTKLPGIGQQLLGGKHILIDREDRRSQIKTFKMGMQWLKQGVSLMAFPEGMRSPTGRLGEFKGGLFVMAIKMGVPIVPLTLHHTHSIFPPYALLPIQAGAKKLHVHIHNPIDSQGKTDEELAQLVRQAFCSTLPLCQQPLGLDTDDTMTKKDDTAAMSNLVENKSMMLVNDMDSTRTDSL